MVFSYFFDCFEKIGSENLNTESNNCFEKIGSKNLNTESNKIVKRKINFVAIGALTYKNLFGLFYSIRDTSNYILLFCHEDFEK